jgi:hypothetical protein
VSYLIYMLSLEPGHHIRCNFHCPTDFLLWDPGWLKEPIYNQTCGLILTTVLGNLVGDLLLALVDSRVMSYS